MSYDDDADAADHKSILTLVVCLLILSTVCLGLYWQRAYACQARWDGMFMASWGPAQGCRIYVQGQWIPETAWRATP